MHYDPKCKNKKHKCKEVCISPSCNQANPFICDRCDSTHKGPSCEVIQYKKMVIQFHKIQGLYTNEMLKYEERVENTFSELMNELRGHFVKFREEFEYMNIEEKIQNIYLKIKGNKESELTGAILSKAIKQKPLKTPPLRVKDELSMRILKQNIEQIYYKAMKKLPPYYSLKAQLEDESEFMQDNFVKNVQDHYVVKRKTVKGIFNPYFQEFEEMLGKPIYNVQLLYKATEHNFSAREFHRKCDGIANTITVAKTEFGSIVIGYSTFPWESPKGWEYKVDGKGECFLMSPSEKLKERKFTPIKTRFSIGMHQDYGPSFGDDFVIYDKAQNSKNCWSNFPDVYTCKQKPVDHNPDTIKAFVGVEDHFQKFNLVEWQVYHISFSKQDELQKSFMREYRKIPYNKS